MMEHIDLILPSLRRFIHTLLNEVATCKFQNEESLKKLSSEIEGLWGFEFEQPDDASAVLLWYVLKAIEDWMPNPSFECGWSEQLQSHERIASQAEPDSLDIVPDYSIINPHAYFPRMSKDVHIGWKEIFDTQILCMISPEYVQNTHLRILLLSDQDIPSNRIIELMPAELSDVEIATLELNYLQDMFTDGNQHTPLRFTTNQLTWILSNYIRKYGRNSIPHFVHVSGHPVVNHREELPERASPPESDLLRNYVQAYMRPAIKRYLYSHPLKPRPPIPEKYPLGSKLHPIFHIRHYDDGRPSTGLFVGLIIAYIRDFPETSLVEATEFIEYDAETKDYLDAMTSPERFPYAGYASILIGQTVLLLWRAKR